MLSLHFEPILMHKDSKTLPSGPGMKRYYCMLLLTKFFNGFFSYCISTFNGHREWVRRVKVSPDGEFYINALFT